LTLSPHIQADPSDNIFDDDLSTHTGSPAGSLHDELEAYLNIKPDPGIKDVFAWWKTHRETYPRLYRMALDYHTIPGE
jgi:hypothetical protein